MSTDDTADFSGMNAFSSRGPGYAVARKCLEVQAEAERQDPSLHTDKRVVIHDDAWPWFTGALGEIEVGRMLDELGPEWFVRHSVPIGSGTKDVDHLVIGPGGVFAINTKHHRGAKVWVGDYVVGIGASTKPYLQASRAEGLDVARRLGAKVDFAVPVTPVIAILNSQSLVDRRRQDTRIVTVLEARRLVAWMKQQPHQLSETKLALIKLAAEEPATWHVDPRAADTYRVMPRFERLVEQVGARPPTPRATATRPVRQARVSSASRSKSRTGDVVRLWLTLVVLVVGFFIFRSVASEPCTPASTVGCIVAPMYSGLKPLLELAIAVGVVVCVVATLVTLVRSLSKTK